MSMYPMHFNLLLVSVVNNNSMYFTTIRIGVSNCFFQQ